jgi:hypothetical protein
MISVMPGDDGRLGRGDDAARVECGASAPPSWRRYDQERRFAPHSTSESLPVKAAVIEEGSAVTRR